ncbi:MAG: hypothetical protein K6U89_08750 [Chloroflexi bacterium]|nr:hypothetical protein [Chloroflexota bacterium]GIW10523.1 MAG: hypothetical protein KatS3mg061_1580 [Dehalococcoidia bacterium]
MDERFLPDAAEPTVMLPVEAALELVDRIGPDASRTLILTAVRQFLEADRREVWRRRRERMVHFLNVVEYNLDYDLRTRGLAD